MKPIIFSADMVRAILEGRKTVTRQVIKPQPEVFDNAGCPDYACLENKYNVGDILRVKETYCHRASRIRLEILDIRIERLQEITEEDAIREGIRTVRLPNKVTLYHVGPWPDPMAADTPLGAYRNLWDSARRGRSWEENPWVFVISFEEKKLQRISGHV